MSEDRITRRDFFRRALVTGAALYGLSELGGAELEGVAEAAGGPVLAVAAKSEGPAAAVRAAVNGVGGMGAFVKKGARVVVKPNMGWARTPEQAANTNPHLVAEVVKMCREAGAREVTVIDHPVDDPGEVARLCGIEGPAKAAGARVQTVGSWPSVYEPLSLPHGKRLKNVQVLKEIRHADVLINLPIAKVHGATTLTLGGKNLMGAVSDRGAWHGSDINQCIADFMSAVKPQLTILDAWRIMLTGGPKGPGKTRDAHTVAASVDPVAVDAFGATLFGLAPDGIAHIVAMHQMGLGEIDLKRRVQIKYV